MEGVTIVSGSARAWKPKEAASYFPLFSPSLYKYLIEGL